MIETTVTAKLRFEALHHWPGAIDHGESYLAWPHRHEFHVLVEAEVQHDDRELEFIDMKRRVNDFIRRYVAKPDSISGGIPDLGRTSCESLAKTLLMFLQEEYGDDRGYTVEVLEDGENGACLYYVPDEPEPQLRPYQQEVLGTFEELEAAREREIAAEGKDLAGET